MPKNRFAETSITATAFVVDGDPAAQGSKRLVSLRSGRSVMLENSRKVKPWRSAVAAAARAAQCPLRSGDVLMCVRVRFSRPKSHFTSTGAIRAAAPVRPGYADCDKLARAVCDALTGIAYHDDRQVACLSIEREWSDPGAGNGAVVMLSDAPRAGDWKYCTRP